MRLLTQILRSDDGASAAEFALVVPLLLILLFGVIDGGRFLWEYNEAEKATQIGTRFAVATDPVLSGLSTYSFASSSSDLIAAGSAVPAANFSSAACTSSGCSCSSSTGGFCSAASLDSTAFANLVARMAQIYPQITGENVEVDYKNIGIGFAGDPNGPDVSALVTVKLTGLQFHPVTCLVLPCSIAMPDFHAALTLEDASGSTAN